MNGLEGIAEKIFAVLPPGVQGLSGDVRDLVRDVIKEQLLKLDLVPREEFDIQCALLARTRDKLVELEKVLLAIESKVGSSESSS